jgi:hypothetical protein
VSQFCPHCGQQARPGDRFCVGCGNDINDTEPAGQAADPFRTSDDRRRRTGGFLVAHAKALMALTVVAAVVLAVVLAGSPSTDSSPAADDVVVPFVSEPADQSLPPSAPAPKPKAKPKARRVVATGANGQRYSCSFSVRGRVNASRDRIRAPERALHGMEAALKKLDKKYPGRAAPPASADRYNALLARTRAKLKSANEAISRYNQTLRDACDKT